MKRNLNRNSGPPKMRPLSGIPGICNRHAVRLEAVDNPVEVVLIEVENYGSTQERPTLRNHATP